MIGRELAVNGPRIGRPRSKYQLYPMLDGLVYSPTQERM